MTYIVNFENRANWNSDADINEDSLWIVTDEEISRLAVEWGVSVDELMEQVEEHE